jgi:hypothetical protein
MGFSRSTGGQKLLAAGFETDKETGLPVPFAGLVHHLEFVVSKSEGGVIRFAFGSMLRAYLSLADPPAPYALVNLQTQRQFNGIAAVTLYEKMKMHAGRKYNKSVAVTRKQLPYFLGDFRYCDDKEVDGSVTKTIGRWDNYATHVVAAAVAEIAKFNIAYLFVKHGQGQRVEKVVFTVVAHPKKHLPAEATHSGEWVDNRTHYVARGKFLRGEMSANAYAKLVNEHAVAFARGKLDQLRDPKAVG